MPAEWDVRLPDPELTSLGETGAYPTLISEDKSGPIQLRELHPFGTNEWNYTIQVTTSELGIFEYWWTEVLYHGAAWISNFPIERGSGRELVTAHFKGGAFSVTYIGYELWQVSGVVEIDE